jgi:hypothetical protein|tara:strand:+ start:572 stop:841 length:270 start_codon:yes stop_codon:yes gene_type:complete
LDFAEYVLRNKEKVVQGDGLEGFEELRGQTNMPQATEYSYLARICRFFAIISISRAMYKVYRPTAILVAFRALFEKVPLAIKVIKLIKL